MLFSCEQELSTQEVEYRLWLGTSKRFPSLIHRLSNCGTSDVPVGLFSGNNRFFIVTIFKVQLRLLQYKTCDKNVNWIAHA
jgi:hypothetical protein